MNNYETFPLKDSWKLYYHDVENDNWDISSYKLVTQISSLKDFFKLINTIPNITAGMFFLMKNDIKPVYEDPANKNGISMSIKSSKINSNKLWKEIIAIIIGGTFTKNPDNYNLINGISISPKINNCIFKVWLSSKNISNISHFNFNDLNMIDPNSIIFK